MRALVTGGSGFVGQWLARALLNTDWDVVATRHDDADAPSVLSEREREAVEWVSADARNAAHLRSALDVARPDAVFHLAAVASVAGASADPGLAYDVNTTGAVRLLADVARRRRAGELDPVVIIVGSGEQYGKHGSEEMPLAEGAELRPMTVYAATKAAQEIAALQSARSEGVRVVCTRSFNHSGLGQAEQYLLPALVRRALRLRATGGGRMPIGNTTSVRDYLHVADVVNAYIALARHGASGEVFNVSSGVGWSVRELVDLVVRLVGVPVVLEPDETLVRPVDVPMLVGDPGKIQGATSWQPSRGVATIIEELVHAAA